VAGLTPRAWAISWLRPPALCHQEQDAPLDGAQTDLDPPWPGPDLLQVHVHQHPRSQRSQRCRSRPSPSMATHTPPWAIITRPSSCSTTSSSTRPISSQQGSRRRSSASRPRSLGGQKPKGSCRPPPWSRSELGRAANRRPPPRRRRQATFSLTGHDMEPAKSSYDKHAGNTCPGISPPLALDGSNRCLRALVVTRIASGLSSRWLVLKRCRCAAARGAAPPSSAGCRPRPRSPPAGSRAASSRGDLDPDVDPEQRRLCAAAHPVPRR
jgi:hypothetical protein